MIKIGDIVEFEFGIYCIDHSKTLDEMTNSGYRNWGKVHDITEDGDYIIDVDWGSDSRKDLILRQENQIWLKNTQEI